MSGATVLFSQDSVRMETVRTDPSTGFLRKGLYRKLAVVLVVLAAGAVLVLGLTHVSLALVLMANVQQRPADGNFPITTTAPVASPRCAQDWFSYDKKCYKVCTRKSKLRLIM